MGNQGGLSQKINFISYTYYNLEFKDNILQVNCVQNSLAKGALRRYKRSENVY